MINWLINKFKLPGPKKLGWSKTNALASREFTPFAKNKTWEDYEEYCQENFPLRWKLKKLFRKISLIKYFVGNYWYEFKSRFFIKQHLLDLRQDYNGYDIYSYGYSDPCSQVLYANFNILKNFVEKENPRRPEDYEPSDDEFDELDELDQQWQEASIEIYDLYDYWMNRRAELNKECVANYKAVKFSSTKEISDELRKKWAKSKDAFEEEEQKNLERLIKVRRYMWT